MRLRALLLASLILPATPGLAQEAAEAAATDSGDTIIVTGTRRTDRTVADSPVPVDVISSEALTRTGLTETARALRKI